MSKERFTERKAELQKAVNRLGEAIAQPENDLVRDAVIQRLEFTSLTVNPIALREKDLATLRDTFQRFPTVREVRLFGSRATGQARRASDLDLAVYAPEATPSEWADICDALENAPLIYELDLVRPERITREQLNLETAVEAHESHGSHETRMNCSELPIHRLGEPKRTL